MDDTDYDELGRIARSRGVSLSDLARETLGTLLTVDPADADEVRFRTGTPESLSAIDRRQLSLLHRIMSYLVPDDASSEDGDPDFQRKRAEVLEMGWVSEYSDEFYEIRPEMPRSESDFVMDVLDMFTQLEWSYGELSGDERKALAEEAKYGLKFGGFDFNNRREGRMASYAKYLIDEGKWEHMAKYFDDDHERGNSHMPTIDMYTRMLEEFRPIWRQKVQAARHGEYNLTTTEIRRVLDARTHPDSR
ncbi:YfbU family protein [Cellulosimicrobium sp. Marseille-Q8652]